MSIRISVIACLVLWAFASCSKNKYQTKPSLTLQSINTPIPVGGTMVAMLKFSQKDGKISQGTFTAIRNRINQTPLPPGTAGTDTLVGPVPQFPDQNQGVFQFSLDYSYLHESDTENDTLVFQFAVVDRAGNASDTIKSAPVVILYQ